MLTFLILRLKFWLLLEDESCTMLARQKELDLTNFAGDLIHSWTKTRGRVEPIGRRQWAQPVYGKLFLGDELYCFLLAIANGIGG
jgi:hypothetical protein